MEKAEKIKTLHSGESKKRYVMSCLRTLIGIDTYNTIEPIAESIIDSIVRISRNGLKINNKLKLFSCIC